jgi:hypothetical protein
MVTVIANFRRIRRLVRMRYVLHMCTGILGRVAIEAFNASRATEVQDRRTVLPPMVAVRGDHHTANRISFLRRVGPMT